MSRVRVLVVDDSPLIRQVLCDMLKQEPEIEVVGVARDGAEAIRLVGELKPDVVTMDVEMPNMTGLEALEGIMATRPTPVVMCSTLTSEGAAVTVRALECGAMDFVCKPKNGAISALRTMRDDLVQKILSARYARVGQIIRRPARLPQSTQATDRVVVIASSTGGPRALAALFEGLPRGLKVPILVVQHMPPGFTASLAARLDKIGTVPCAEATEANRVTPGMAFLAPAGKHMRIKKDGFLEFSMEPSLHGVRPAADYLFKSAAERFGAKTLGVVLTGMGRDGADGSLTIKNAGGMVLGESEETCTIYGMPKSAFATGAVAAEFPIHEMAQAIVANLGGRVARAS